ncbi:hypothetical protein [Bradyrhizobium sp. AS23.2]|uniref:8-oxoguanine DNA glycosylase n=1 Tax=Bradyrhizobium sp. AS23.2 TaxID=1680155 RepID=UPI00093DD4A3|nr:hypothetical protein [Bradyrhizobium sp. AS23.2]OKO67467.1 hypothetical protein AC630_40285 [Bradyrhizobium sp. AS23.2]
MNITPAKLKGAVSAVCRDIEQRIDNSPAADLDDAALWRELSCCVLSSQVPYDLAQSAADQIHLNRALTNDSNRPVHEVHAQLLTILSGNFAMGSSQRRYRFPQMRARQLALSWQAINDQGGLCNLISDTQDIHELRRWLVTHAPGLGPKQASMFLRNIGVTYRLAILDRHVLRYMDIVGLDASLFKAPNSLSAYRTRELVLEEHAKEAGHRLGLLDWAIWIVMRVAGPQLGAAEAR